MGVPDIDQDPDSVPENDKVTPTAPASSPLPASGVDPRLLELLVCPLTKTRLSYRAETGELISAAARLAFPIRDGVPLMIVDAARELGDDEKV